MFTGTANEFFASDEQSAPAMPRQTGEFQAANHYFISHVSGIVNWFRLEHN
jgi:hypothetical protein